MAISQEFVQFKLVLLSICVNGLYNIIKAINMVTLLIIRFDHGHTEQLIN